jgi:hypothetical protein
MNKTLAIATVLMAAALAGILSINPIAFAQDESERQSIAQENVVSGESTNNICGLSIDALSIETAEDEVVECQIFPTPTPTSTGG